MELIRTFWPIIVAVIGAFLAASGAYWKLRHTQERNTWRVLALETRMDGLELEVKSLREGSQSQHLDMRVIQTTLEQIKTLLGDLKEDLRGKADK